ncbi:hypothetical protein HDU84_007190 [Entophlyctis sp. JEL0112]|nr:hypothetical protein HDU84_007190 [Entophlyctis sp. JEL0112]
MSNIDIDISAQYSKTLDRFLDNEFDFVITVCDNANEACPYFKNGKQRLHWSFQDPSQAVGSLTALDLNAVDPTHANFRSALHKRDEVCLFCWGNLQLDAAHLIAQKPSPSLSLIIPDLLSRAGLDSVDRVQNGILLCKVCHGEFDALRRYIDVVDDRFVAKVVNLTSDPRNQEYIDAVGGIEDSRTGKIRRNPAFAGRTVVDGSNELPVYFADGDTTKHPNVTALAFHKAACLIWKMAGAADDIEDDDIDHDGSVDSLLAKSTEHPLASPGAEQSPAISTEPQFAESTNSASLVHIAQSQSTLEGLSADVEVIFCEISWKPCLKRKLYQPSELQVDHSTNSSMEEGLNLEQQDKTPQSLLGPSYTVQMQTTLMDNPPDSTSDPHSSNESIHTLTLLGEHIGAGSRKSYTLETKIRVAEVGLSKGRNIAAKEFGLNGSMVGRGTSKPGNSEINFKQQVLALTQRRRLPDGTSMVSGGRRKQPALSRRDSDDSDDISAGSTHATVASASTSHVAAQRELRKRRGSSLPKVATKRRMDIANRSSEDSGIQKPDSNQPNPLFGMYFPNNPYQPPLLAQTSYQSHEMQNMTHHITHNITHRASEVPHPLPIPGQFSTRGEDSVYLPQVQPTQQYFQQIPSSTHPYENQQRQQQQQLQPLETHRRVVQQSSSMAISAAYLDSPRRPQVMQLRSRVLDTVNALSNAVREYSREESNDSSPDAGDWRQAVNILRDAMESALAILRRGEGGGNTGG